MGRGEPPRVNLLKPAYRIFRLTFLILPVLNSDVKLNFPYIHKGLDLLPKISRKEAKMLFAAHVFVYTSRDGMVISNIVNVSAYRLHLISESPNWTEALKFWNYTGDPAIEGKRYPYEVGRKRISQSLKYARKLWLELFGIKPLKRLPRWTNDENS